jgi:hypothetical protein
MRLVKLFRRWQATLAAYDEVPQSHTEIHRFAARAYEMCATWYGPPQDAHKPYTLLYGPCTALTLDPLKQVYRVVVSEGNQTDEQKCAAIAHEIYHRVTFLCAGLRRTLWVDEMMAFLTSQHVLIEIGFGDYAMTRRKAYTSRPLILAVDALGRAKRRRILFGIGGISYPEGFAAGVATVGCQLEDIVGWDHMRQVLACRDWQEWLLSLPPRKRAQAGRLLQIHEYIQMPCP